MTKLLIAAIALLVTGDKDLAGTNGTVTSWEDDKVLVVERCDGDEVIGWDYPTCARVLRQKTGELLCARGLGTYKWQFQVGAEKPLIDQTTTCKVE
jgi:hypothetical protein